MKKHIVIAGCGFGGVAALRRLSVCSDQFRITVIDKKTTFDFLPLLPDMVSRDLSRAFLTVDIAGLCRRHSADFINQEIVTLDHQTHTLRTKQSSINYDQLIIASGAETHFYGNTDLARNAMPLRSVQDAQNLKDVIAHETFEHFFIAGGGYTGIEIATHLKRWMKSRHITASVHIIEKADSILGPLPAWMKKYTLKQLEQMGVDLLCGTTVRSVDGQYLILSDDSRYPNALVVWVAGVKMPAFIEQLDSEKIQNRLKVNPFLQVRDNLYAIGDCAAFMDHDKPLRMAVMFAIGQGRCAADNIIRSYRNKPLIPYHPVDLGYIIPTANNRSSGVVLGRGLKGVLPTLLHYTISAYRSYGWRNRLGVLSHTFRHW